MSFVYSAAALAVVGASVSAYSAYQGGQAASQAANYNAALAQQQATATRNAAAAKALSERQNNALLLKKQQADYAAAGVVASEGSPLVEEAKQAGYMELHAENTEYAGDIAANVDMEQSQLDIAQGQEAKTTGDLNATASLISGANKAGNDIYG